VTTNRGSRRRLALAAIAAVALCAWPAVAARANGVVDEAVTFHVVNTNRSLVPCSSDGQPYAIRGHLVAPAATFDGDRARSVTLYLHGLGYGEFFWRFRAVSGYDYATELARAGHASVVIDRLGYGTSDHPQGTATCVGAQADMAHQIIQALRAGHYSATETPTFQRVALAGHSAGGLIAQVETYSFGDPDALVVMSWADQGSSERALTTFAQTGQVCSGGGQPANGPAGYAYFGQTPSDFKAAMFFDASPEVISDATAMRNRDPCGDTNSVTTGIAADQLGLPTIKVPVLLAYGDDDALFPPPAGSLQQPRFAGSRDVTATFLPDTGHAVTLERSAPELRKRVGSWLAAHGF
jgi:pimeloyl-ACP methyl ester carboxylesterase